MHIYDTLIIGSGYSSQGFALARKNCIICEESQCCDPHFYLPLRSFMHTKYTPTTYLGKKLNNIFKKYNLFKDNLMCTNGFESAFCEFLSQNQTSTLLKCRVVSITNQADGIYNVRVYTNEGLSSLYAKNVIDTTGTYDTAKRYITVLYMTENADKAEKALSKVFSGSIFTSAFYEKRYAMHVPVGKIDDVNEMINKISDTWLTAETDAKVLYIAPVFFSTGDEKTECTLFPMDYNFANPIAAFESGIHFAGGDGK